MSAREIELRIIPRHEADECVRRWHYSGKTYVKSTLHVGVLWRGALLGAIQCGEGVCTPCMAHIVEGTTAETYIEINRMAMSDALPRNSESRALSVLWRIIARERPAVEWVVSYSDATQCGDGAIYRAAGMLLTGCRRNTTLWRTPDGDVVSDVGMRTGGDLSARYGTSRHQWRAAGLEPLPGYQLRYILFLRSEARARLLVPVLPYSSTPRTPAWSEGSARSPARLAPVPHRMGGRTDLSAPQSLSRTKCACSTASDSAHLRAQREKSTGSLTL